jgi:hypothetical protein
VLVKIGLRAPVPPGVTVEIAAARGLPIDWDHWRVAIAGTGEPHDVFSQPEGWPVTIVDASDAVHAFYVVLDLAVHARARLPADATAVVRAQARGALLAAAPTWDDAIVALADL